MQTLQERLEELMRTKSWGREDLIRISGQSQSVVSQWLGKSSKLIKTIGKLEAAQALAAASGFEALWIAKGIGPKLSTTAASMAEAVVFHPQALPAEPEIQPPAPLDWRTAAVMMARQCPDADQRVLLMEFVREVDRAVAESAQSPPIRAKLPTP